MGSLLQALTKSGLVSRSKADEIEHERTQAAERRQAEEHERLAAKKAAKSRPPSPSGDQSEYQTNSDEGRRDPLTEGGARPSSVPLVREGSVPSP